MNQIDPNEREPVIDLSELERIVRAEPLNGPATDEAYYLAEIAKRTRQSADRLQDVELGIKLSRDALVNINSNIRSELTAIRWALFVLVLLAVQAFFIWAPKGWWHTPFWAYL